MNLKEIETEFGLTKYSTVSSIVVRTEALLCLDKRLQKLVAGIKKFIVAKGQAKT